MQPLEVRGFVTFALGPDLLSRFINLVLWMLMSVKYVTMLHMTTKSLLPRVPHLLVNVRQCGGPCMPTAGRSTAGAHPPLQHLFHSVSLLRLKALGCMAGMLC